MRKHLLYCCVPIIFMSLLAGCATRGDFTAISGKNVNLSTVNLDRKKMKGRAHGEDCQNIILFIPTSGAPTLKEAMDRAMEQEKTNLLLDAVVKFHTFYIPLLFGQTCWIVEGDAYDTYE